MLVICISSVEDSTNISINVSMKLQFKTHTRNGAAKRNPGKFRSPPQHESFAIEQDSG